jgi:peptidoglycan/LPS O-acetylase OafA/YrhL
MNINNGSKPKPVHDYHSKLIFDFFNRMNGHQRPYLMFYTSVARTLRTQRSLFHNVPFVWASLNYIGKISYILYLTHLVVLFSCIHLLHGVIPTWAICLVVLVLTFVMSSSMYYLVERPSMKLGKNISRILDLNSKDKTITTSPNTKTL